MQRTLTAAEAVLLEVILQRSRAIREEVDRLDAQREALDEKIGALLAEEQREKASLAEVLGADLSAEVVRAAEGWLVEVPDEPPEPTAVAAE